MTDFSRSVWTIPVRRGNERLRVVPLARAVAAEARAAELEEALRIVYNAFDGPGWTAEYQERAVELRAAIRDVLEAAPLATSLRAAEGGDMKGQTSEPLCPWCEKPIRRLVHDRYCLYCGKDVQTAPARPISDPPAEAEHALKGKGAK